VSKSIDWEELKRELSFKDVVSIKFRIDGHLISISRDDVVRNYKFKSKFIVFIDGMCRGNWGVEDKPIIEKVWKKVVKHIYSKAQRADFKKRFGKKFAKLLLDYDRKIVFYSPIFNNVEELISTFKKIDNLEVAEDDK